MGNRIDLQKMLEELIDTKQVYFEPPESIKLSYPCIIYGLSNEDVRFADDVKYLKKKAYDLTVISRNPDDELFDKVSDIQYCIFDRRFDTSNLTHTVYRLYF